MHYRKFTGLIAGLLVFLAAAGALHAQVLTVTNGLQLWLKADAGVTTNAAGGVTQWTDQSPNGNNAVQTSDVSAPQFVAGAQNGKPALRFDGITNFLDVASSPSIAIAGDISSFFVVKFDDFATYRAVWGKTAGNFPAPTDYYLQPGTGIPTAFRGDGSRFQVGNVNGAAGLRANTYSVVGFEMAATTMTHYLNGQPNGSGEITAQPADGNTALKVGTRDDFVTKLKGEIAELLIYDVALSDTDRDSVINYLKVKYNIINLPPTIALASAPPGPNVNVGDLVTLNATAADPDGSVFKVDFFANGLLLRTATTNPYSVRLRIETAGNVVFTAMATDDKGGTATSTPLTLSAGPATTPPLTVTNGLQLWLKADAGVTTDTGGGVMGWADQSGNGNNAVQTNETLAPLPVANAVNGNPVLRFDGVDDYLDVASSPGLAITNDIASFFVVRFEDFGFYRAVWGKTAGPGYNEPRPTDYYLLPGSGIPRAYRGSDDEGNDAVDGAAGVITNTYLVLGFNQAGPTFTHFVNGEPFGSGRIRVRPGDDGTDLIIGSREDLFTQMNGDIAELLIYNRALDDAQLQSLQSYLGAKYGLPMVVPTNSPPSVTVTNPPNGSTLAAPTKIIVGADAADSDGSVVRVDFYIGAGRVGSASSAPFSAAVDVPPAPGALTLRAVATDNLGLASTSAPVTINVTASPVPLPSATRLKLWLRADAGVITNSNGGVSAWNDQSGNFNNAAQTDATAMPQWTGGAVNGRPALRFDGANDYLTVPHASDLAITGDLSTFFVVTFDDFANYRAVWAATGGGSAIPTDYYLLPDDSGAPGIPRAWRGNFAGAGSVDGTAAPPTNQYVIAGFDMAGVTLRHYLNGQENGSGDITNKIADAEGPLFIGTRDDLFTKMKGAIAEIVIYDIALSDADRNAVFSYLAGKYGIDIGAGAPSLTVVWSGNNIMISWPGSAGGFLLESSDVLPAVNWTNVPFNPPPPGQNASVTVTPAGKSQYYRLRHP